MNEIYAAEIHALEKAADHLQGALLVMPMVIMEPRLFEAKLSPVLTYLALKLQVQIKITQVPTTNQNGSFNIRTTCFHRSYEINRSTRLLKGILR